LAIRQALSIFPFDSCRAADVIELPEDFRDFLIELSDAGAAFVVLGGHAVAFHGHPRAAKDLNVLIKADADNAARVYRALAAYDGVLQVGLHPGASISSTAQTELLSMKRSRRS
jgi:hypothetical protein